MTQNPAKPDQSNEDLFNSIAHQISTLYDPPLSLLEARKAATNLVGFFTILIEINNELGENE